MSEAIGTVEATWDPQTQQAVVFMYDNLIPYCVECASIRDLAACESCTDAGDGMWVLCPPCLAKHFRDCPDCVMEGEENSFPVAPDFRFTRHG